MVEPFDAVDVIRTKRDSGVLSDEQIAWVVDAYTLSFAALLLPAGKLSDRWGRRRMLLVGLAGFAVVSAATAFSWALWQLVTLRVVLGVCAALIYPATLSSIIVIFEGSRDFQAAFNELWSVVASKVLPLVDDILNEFVGEFLAQVAWGFDGVIGFDVLSHDQPPFARHLRSPRRA